MTQDHVSNYRQKFLDLPRATGSGRDEGGATTGRPTALNLALRVYREGAEGETVTSATRAVSANQIRLLAIALVDSTLKGTSTPQARPR